MSTLICKKINFFIFSVSVPFYYILHYMNCKDFCYFPLLCLLLRFSVLKYKNNRAISSLIFACFFHFETNCAKLNMRLFRLLDLYRGKELARPKQYRGAKGIGIIMNSKLKNADTDFLFDCVLSLKTREECYDFFEDLCTVTELKAISQRIVVAKMLSDDRVYSDIVKETGASTATISRVNRSLQFGCNGYEKIFERVEEKDK